MEVTNMSTDLCLNGHEILPEYRFCVTCGAERPGAPEEPIPHLVITLDDDATDAPAAEIPGSIGYLAPVEEVVPAAVAEGESVDAKRARLHAARDAAYEEINALEALQQEIANWESRNTHSFRAKTSEKMRQNMSDAEGLLAHYTRTVESLAIPEPGRMAKLRKSFHRKLLWQTVIISLVTYLIYKIPRIVFAEDVMLYNQWAADGKMLTIYASILWFILFLAALVSYYRGWSQYQRRVITTLFQLHEVSRSVEHVRNEQSRLKALYPQVSDWLLILGHSLTKPWSIRKEWFESSIGDLSEAALPNSLRIAQADEEDGPAMMEMQRNAAEHFMSRGWRAKVFADQIDVIRESLGFQKDRLNVDTLDQDILYSPNGPRSIVRSNIEEQTILESIGRRQLLPLIKHIQQEGITKSRPPVDEIRKAAIKTRNKAAEDDADTHLTPWDEFLGLSVPTEGKPRTPLSVFSLSDSGKVAGHHDRYKTFMIVPERFRNRVTGVDDRQLHTYAESTKLPMDVVVRADFTGPIPGEDLLFLAKTRVQREAEAAAEEKAPKAPRKSGI